MNIIILLTAILFLLISINSFRMRAKNIVFRWIAIVFYCVAIGLFINIFGYIGGFFVGIPTSLACGLLIAFVLGKPKN